MSGSPCLSRGLVGCLFAFLPIPIAADCGPRAPFLRGDADSSGHVNITDPITVLEYLFMSGRPGTCFDAIDGNDDGTVTVTDAVFLLQSLFTGGPPPPPPSGDCARDPTEDELTCDAFPPCSTGSSSREVCDRTDNDCDGAVDEDFDLESDPRHCGACDNDCRLLDAENVVAYKCVEGKCSVAECEEGFWDRDRIVETGCESVIPPNGAPCDDGNPCTEGDMYIGGLCGGTPKNCSSVADICNQGLCDRETGECIQEPRPGRPCDDGDPDTASDRCTITGECAGTQVRGGG